MNYFIRRKFYHTYSVVVGCTIRTEGWLAYSNIHALISNALQIHLLIPYLIRVRVP